jgi:hypothetical protein
MFEFEEGDACRVKSNRCPTHPGALLRQDVIPATAGQKPRLHNFSAHPANIFTIFWVCFSIQPGDRACVSLHHPSVVFGRKRFFIALTRFDLLGTGPLIPSISQWR